jgi:Acyl-CoA dehydrogenase, N-terminal domain.
MARFSGLDYYEIDGLLNEEEILVRNTVREFTEEQILPIIEKNYRIGTFPLDLVPKMADLRNVWFNFTC